MRTFGPFGSAGESVAIDLRVREAASERKRPAGDDKLAVFALDRVDSVVHGELCDRQRAGGMDRRQLRPRRLNQLQQLLVPLNHLVRLGLTRGGGDRMALGLPSEARARKAEGGHNDQGKRRASFHDRGFSNRVDIYYSLSDDAT